MLAGHGVLVAAAPERVDPSYQSERGGNENRPLQPAVDSRHARTEQRRRLARNPATSRRISAARCRGARCWIAATNPTSSVSRATAASYGSTNRSGYGSSHPTSAAIGGTSPSGSAAGATSTANTRGPRRATCSRHAFVAMRYSQARNDHHPPRLNRARARQARANVSCTRSSDSSNDPTIRQQCARSSRRWRSKSAEKVVSSASTPN
jgi:hypothetical protein